MNQGAVLGEDREDGMPPYDAHLRDVRWAGWNVQKST